MSSIKCRQTTWGETQRSTNPTIQPYNMLLCSPFSLGHRLKSRMTCSKPERTASAVARSHICFLRAASRVNEVSTVARGIGLFEGVLSNGTQLPRDGDKFDKRPPIQIGMWRFLQSSRGYRFLLCGRDIPRCRLRLAKLPMKQCFNCRSSKHRGRLPFGILKCAVCRANLLPNVVADLLIRYEEQVYRSGGLSLISTLRQYPADGMYNVLAGNGHDGERSLPKSSIVRRSARLPLSQPLGPRNPPRRLQATRWATAEAEGRSLVEERRAHQ